VEGIGERELAFRRIYEAHYGRIRAYARRRVDEPDVDDTVADTFLIAWRRLDDIPEGEATLPWLYAVARRVISQRRRTFRRRDRLVVRLGGLRDDVATGVAELEGIDEQERIRSALAMLRDADQEILRLAEWEDLSSKELAVVFDCSPNAIAIRLHRAHKRFGKALNAIDQKADAASREREPR
jgi:RNA polymerase sigma factor (sigma-70 family)